MVFETKSEGVGDFLAALCKFHRVIDSEEDHLQLQNRK
jgi:hypothetical protein